MGMKKLYFLNEEESKRILNLHKDATKKQYLSEQYKQDIPLTGSEGGTNVDFLKKQEAAKAEAAKAEAAKAAEAKAAADKAAAAAKATAAIKGPLITKIQQLLKDKGFKLGTSGPNKDGVDGVMGNITLNGIISALGGGTTLN